jgi:ATP adenylyltransferase
MDRHPEELQNVMETRFAPWRASYITGEKPSGCIFCRDSLRGDDLILHEGKAAFVTLNRYPYNNGHLMIIPLRHVSQIEDLTPPEREEILMLLEVSVRTLKEVMRVEGLNIGLNLGQAAGAGVADHLHVHVVPRWSGDTNYMSTVGSVRVIPEDLYQTREKLLPYFKKIQEV